MLSGLPGDEQQLLWRFLSAASKQFAAEDHPLAADALSALGLLAVTASGRPPAAQRAAEAVRGP